jgi:succinate dehydrogenase/fumarate reductase flavoprotein subunit
MTARRDEADVLIIGAGMAGLAAAARSVQLGASVMLVEKGERTGGSAVHAEFIWTAPTLEVLRTVNPLGDEQLAERLLGSRRSALDWVVAIGVPIEPEVELLGFGTGHRTDVGALLSTMERVVRDDPHSTILRRTDVERLLRDDAGAVTGAVLVADDGARRAVTARTTVLATGGFAGDPELRAELIHPQARDIPLRANPHSNGRGLALGRSVGAAVGADGAGFYGHLMPAGVQPDPQVGLAKLSFFHSEHGVLVNRHGRRFVDETIGDHLNTMATLEQPDARALLICDQRVHREWMLSAYVKGLEPIDKFALAYRLGARCATADSVEEFTDLPPEWGYPGEAVRNALLEFNAQCAAGSPAPPRRRDAVALTEPPYYVIELAPAITFTFTGLLTDARARVLDGDGRPIGGLLAAGADAGGLYVRAYAGGLAAALVFGLTAAETATQPTDCQGAHRCQPPVATPYR